MAYCPAGHTSTAADYCDQCGLPIEAGGGSAPRAAVVAEAPAGAVCANCGVANAADALFCEACGYDFTTGTPPRSAASPEPAETPASEPGELPQTWGGAGASANWTAPAAPTDQDPADATPADREPSGGMPAEPQAADRPEQPAARPARQRPALSDWVAEVWIDPDWYKTQGSTDPLPSPGLPEVIALRASTALIGRTSASRNIHPDIDCAIDTGVSRRHAQVSTDGTRWWIEDLESANGTFIGSSAGPLPSMPIGRGRVEFAPDQRIYLGGWTRIVIRPATEDEHEAFTASAGHI